jgi:hypothetical protein
MLAPAAPKLPEKRVQPSFSLGTTRSLFPLVALSQLVGFIDFALLYFYTGSIHWT